MVINNIKKITILSFLAFLSFSTTKAYANQDLNIETKIKLEKAPEINAINFETKETLTLEQFKDKIILLDFWATWCGPCLESMPYLNKIQERYKEDIVVIAISDEKDKTIKKFLKDKKFNFIIGQDINNDTNIAYPHSWIPYTVMINKNKEILGEIFPLKLTYNMIDKMIAENKSLDDIKKDFKIPKEYQTYLALSLSNKKQKTETYFITHDNDFQEIKIENQPLIKIYKKVLGNYIAESNIVNKIKNLKYKDNRYNFYLRYNIKDTQDNFKYLLNSLDLSSGISSKIEKLEKETLLLKIKNTDKLKSNSNNLKKVKISDNKFEGLAINSLDLKNFIQNKFNITVIDETNINGKLFDLNIDFNDSIEDFKNKLSDYDFYLEKENRIVDILTLE
ncbi:MAG: TlpA disulfide reductase family protein [Candidatus Sericytochromatia bacterium]